MPKFFAIFLVSVGAFFTEGCASSFQMQMTSPSGVARQIFTEPPIQIIPNMLNVSFVTAEDQCGKIRAIGYVGRTMLVSGSSFTCWMSQNGYASITVRGYSIIASDTAYVGFATGQFSTYANANNRPWVITRLCRPGDSYCSF